jgi:low temperature requirement protein LtrA
VRKVVDATIAYTYLHYLVVAGVILIAVGIEQTTAHIDDPAPLGWFGGAALAGGVALYQAATVFVWYRMTGRWLVARLVSSTLLLPGIALAALLPALGGIAAAVILGVVLLTIEARTGALEVPQKVTATDG